MYEVLFLIDISMVLCYIVFQLRFTSFGKKKNVTTLCRFQVFLFFLALILISMYGIEQKTHKYVYPVPQSQS